MHRHQSVARLVEIEELLLLLHEGEVAVQVVAPGVVLAGELAAGTGGLFPRLVVPHQLVAAVAADVVVRLHLAAAGAHHDDRGVDGRQFFGEVVALPRNLFGATDIEPGALEDRLALQLVDLRVDRVLVGHRPGAEFGVVLRPAAFSGLGKTSHGCSCQAVGIGRRRETCFADGICSKSQSQVVDIARPEPSPRRNR